MKDEMKRSMNLPQAQQEALHIHTAPRPGEELKMARKSSSNPSSGRGAVSV